MHAHSFQYFFLKMCMSMMSITCVASYQFQAAQQTLYIMETAEVRKNPTSMPLQTFCNPQQPLTLDMSCTLQ